MYALHYTVHQFDQSSKGRIRLIKRAFVFVSIVGRFFFFFKSVLYQLFWPFWILRFTQNQNNNVKVNLHTQLKSQHTHIKEILTNKPCSLAGWLTIFAKCCEQYDDRLRRLGLGWRRRLVHHRGFSHPFCSPAPPPPPPFPKSLRALLSSSSASDIW